MMVYRAGIVGVGRKGLTIDDERKCAINYSEGPASHAGAYAALPEVELVAVADPDPQALARTQHRYPAVRAYHTYGEMLSRESLDIVSVATQAPEHAAATIAAAEAGARAIICEKAMATSMEEADAMLDVTDRFGSRLLVDHPRRYHPTYVAARKAVEDGAIGSLQTMLAVVGGWIVHNGSHFFDLFGYFAGPAESISATVSGRRGRDGHGNARLTFAGGVVGFLDAQSRTDVRFILLGERGTIAIDGSAPGYQLTTYTATPMSPPDDELWFKGTPCGERSVRHVRARSIEGTLTTLIRDAITCIEGGAEPRSSGTEGAAALEMALAAFLSSDRSGASVKLPLEDRSLRIVSR